MNAPIFNRDFAHPADSTYMIEPAGEHPNNNAGVTQVIDSAARKSIVNRFNADADAGRLSHGHEMLIDREHFKHDSDKETVAYGWLQKLENRDDGIYGKIRWTSTGKAAVDGGDYRFFSTEYDPSDLESLNSDATLRVRPTRLDGLTLTNMPNNKGGQPITNRAPSEPPSIHPELDDWFRAVSAVQDSAKRHTHTSVTFNDAWQIAKQVHADKHAAAFNPVITTAQNDLLKTAQAVKEITNRVDSATGYGPRWSRIVVREQLPEIFRGMRVAAGCDAGPTFNRDTWEHDPRASATNAAKVFAGLVEAEKKEYGISLSHAFSRVSNREPVLASLAKGDITVEAAFQREPALRNRLS